MNRLTAYRNRFKELPIAGITLPSSAFYNRYKNFIVYTRYKNDFWARSNHIVYPAENRDKVYIYGLELSRKFNISRNMKLSGGIYNFTVLKYWDYLSHNKLYLTAVHNYLKVFISSGRTFQLGLNIDY